MATKQLKEEQRRKKSGLKTFHVYFSQINADYIGVEAKDKECAKVKAVRKWRENYGPRVIDVQEVEYD